MKKFRKLSIFLLLISFVYSKSSNQLLNSFLYNASYGGNLGYYYQQGIEGPTFFDVNIGAGYESDSFNNFRLGSGFILTGPIYQNPKHAFSDSKEVFILNSAYLNYINRDIYLNVAVGRFKSYEEWSNNYIQGISVSYNGLPNTSFNSTISFGNAIIRNDYITEFRRDLEYDGFGNYLFRVNYDIPTIINLNSFLNHNSFFTSLGGRGSFGYENKDANFETSVEIIGYYSHYPHNFNPRSSVHSLKIKEALHIPSEDNKSVVAFLKQNIEMHSIHIKLGLVGVTSGGAKFIDYYGHKLPFENTVGIFWPNSFTVYGDLGISHIPELGNFSFNFGIRQTLLPNGNIFNMGIESEYKPLEYLKIGLGFLVVYNNSHVIDFLEEGDYMLLKSFVKYVF